MRKLVKITCKKTLQRRHFRALKIAPEVAFNARQEVKISGFAVTLSEAGQDTENFCIPLCRKNSVIALESRAIERAGGDGAQRVIFDHVFGESLIDVAAGVFQEGDQIIGGAAIKSVLEIDYSDAFNAVAAGKPDQIFGVKVAQDIVVRRRQLAELVAP